MRLISPAGENFLDFLELRQVLSTYDGDLRVGNGEESSGSGTDSTQGLRTQHRREWNPERPGSNSHGDWPFLRPPEHVPEVPVVSREHLCQLEKIQEVLPARRDEAICAEASRG